MIFPLMDKFLCFQIFMVDFKVTFFVKNLIYSSYQSCPQLIYQEFVREFWSIIVHVESSHHLWGNLCICSQKAAFLSPLIRWLPTLQPQRTPIEHWRESCTARLTIHYYPIFLIERRNIWPINFLALQKCL